MEEKLSNLEQVKRDAERLTLRRIRENAEDAGLPVPPRAAHGDTVLPKQKKAEAKPEVKTEEQTQKKKHVLHMNKEELLAEATDKGVEVPEGATNEEIREALKKKGE